MFNTVGRQRLLRRQRITINALERKVQRIYEEAGGKPPEEGKEEKPVDMENYITFLLADASGKIKDLGKKKQANEEEAKKKKRIRGGERTAQEDVSVKQEYRKETVEVQRLLDKLDELVEPKLKEERDLLARAEASDERAEKKGFWSKMSDKDKAKKKLQEKSEQFADYRSYKDTIIALRGEFDKVRLTDDQLGDKQELEAMIAEAREKEVTWEQFQAVAQEEQSPEDVADIQDMDRRQQEYEEQRDEKLEAMRTHLRQVREGARRMGDELDQQERVIETVEAKTEKHTADLKEVNRRLGGIVDQQGCNASYTYMACFLLILALFGVVVYHFDLVPT